VFQIRNKKPISPSAARFLLFPGQLAAAMFWCILSWHRQLEQFSSVVTFGRYFGTSFQVLVITIFFMQEVANPTITAFTTTPLALFVVGLYLKCEENILTKTPPGYIHIYSTSCNFLQRWCSNSRSLD
jgi:hypothetical protein